MNIDINKKYLCEKKFRKIFKKSIFSGENKTEVYLRRNQLIASIKVMNLEYFMTYIY